MDPDVKATRVYRSSRRAAQAARTRAAVVAAARELFASQGYAATSVAQIAARAGVAADTVYAAVGRKPELIRETLETAISGTDTAVAAEDRHYVRAIRAAPNAEDKIAIYAAAVAEIAPRTAPLHVALREAAAVDRACAGLAEELSERRAANMRLFAADLRATGSLRPDLSDDDVAAIVWSMNAAEYYLLLARRGWDAQRYGQFLADSWRRLLLAP